MIEHIESEDGTDSSINILKVRGNSEPLEFSGGAGDYSFCEGFEASWADETGFNEKQLREQIEPWLTSLFQSEHLSLLAGSGLTHAVHHMAVGCSAAGMDKIELGMHQEIIDRAAKESSDKAGRKEGNLEDQLRAANELLRGLEVLRDDDANELKGALNAGLGHLATSILESERNIATANTKEREGAFNTLVTFLMSYASRTGVRDRLNIFTTNYDRLIEAGAEVAGLHLLDRFLGTLMPIFRSSRLDLDMHYNPPGIRGEPRYLEGVARFTKLHGSVDWMQVDDDIRRIGLPFGAEEVAPYLKAPGHGSNTSRGLMVYPNAAKDRETAAYPYVDLFRDLAAAICRPNSTLVTYGYSFGDEHINRVIRDMLTIPSTHLVIISRDDPLGRIMKNYKAIGRPSQISLLIGPALADLEVLTKHFLPKPSIDRTTLRMSHLLNQRMGAQEKRHESPGPNTDNSSGVSFL